MKCTVCNSELDKKNHGCPIYNQEICRSCCARIRDWCKCPITCKFFKVHQNKPHFSFKDGKLEEVDGGDIIHLCDYLFLPNLYDCISFHLLKTEISFYDLQKLDLNIKFKLINESETEADNILNRESWKSEFYPFSLENSNSHPLFGVSLSKRGLFSLNKDEIQFSPVNFTPSVTYCTISSPFQRPIVPKTHINEDVNFIFARNLMILENFDLISHILLNCDYLV